MANVLLGISGGIAVYKTCELIRNLQKSGHEVQVILTKSATKFVTPLTFEALTRHPAHQNLFNDSLLGTAHIQLARWADVFVIAPATAQTLMKCATGFADNLLSTVFLAHNQPTLFAPAMNTSMWEHPSTQAHLMKLKSQHHTLIEPDSGELACGEVGKGKMASIQTIEAHINSFLNLQFTLKNKTVVITAGATREYLDPVRFISSPSTGTFGKHIALEAAKKGAKVFYIHGHVSSLPQNPNVHCISAPNAQSMLKAALAHNHFDVFIATAAVSDFAPLKQESQKIKKNNVLTELKLKTNPDVLFEVSKHKQPHQKLIGFAAETQNVLENAHTKLKEKNLDLIVANEVFEESKGFAQEQTSVYFLTSKSHETYKNEPKAHLAKLLIQKIEQLLK